jgi:hypothetical protein
MHLLYTAVVYVAVFLVCQWSGRQLAQHYQDRRELAAAQFAGLIGAGGADCSSASCATTSAPSAALGDAAGRRVRRDAVGMEGSRSPAPLSAPPRGARAGTRAGGGTRSARDLVTALWRGAPPSTAWGTGNATEAVAAVQGHLARTLLASVDGVNPGGETPGARAASYTA